LPKEIEGFGYRGCPAFPANDARRSVQWRSAHIRRRAGRAIRLAFRFRGADLFVAREP